MGRKGRILFGVILLLTGGGCFLYPNFREWKLQWEVDQVIKRLKEGELEPPDEAGKSEKSEEKRIEKSEEKGETESEGKSKAAEDEAATGEWSGIGSAASCELYAEMKRYNENLAVSGQSIADAWSCEQAPIGVALPDGKDSAVGCIEIPDMRVRLPLYLGASDENLSRGAAVLSGTSMPIGGENTNCVIAGHRGWRGGAYFLHIEDMKTGSEVHITTPWETLTYKVTGTQIVEPTEEDAIMIREGKDMVTLLSCHPYMLGDSPYRYLVFCERAGTTGRAGKERVTDAHRGSPGARPEETGTSASGRVIRSESLIRIALPTVILSITAVVVSVRHGRGRRGKKSRRP